jgi:hypothetical protein
MQPDYWTRFIQDHGLAGTAVEVPAEADISGLGIELEFFDEEGTRSEAEDLFPGIRVLEDGFIPVAGDALGSGDPYFINIRDGDGGPLYRIYHDAVGENGYDPNKAVVVVLKDYREMLAYAQDRRTSR